MSIEKEPNLPKQQLKMRKKFSLEEEFGVINETKDSRENLRIFKKMMAKMLR